MRSNWQYLLLAFALAVFSWYLISGREKVDTWIQVPVEMVNVPEGYVVRQGMVSRIEVRVRGPRPILRTMDIRSAFYPLDLAELQTGMNVLEFEKRKIGLSRAIEVVEIQPSRVELLVDREVTKTVPVQMQFEVALHDDFELFEAILKPAEVKLRGPQTIVETVDEVQTQLVKVEENRPGQVETTVGLVLPAEVESEPGRVVMLLEFREKQTEVNVKAKVGVPELAGREVRLHPESVSMRLRLPVSLARNKSWLESIQAWPPALDDFLPGEHSGRWYVELPEDVVVLERDPDTVTVLISHLPLQEADGAK
jgi:YbbR domain-containing protein